MRTVLAHVEKITKIYPIEKADKIEMAVVQDWHVVVKKNEFKVGDLCVYCEIDSILPDGLPQEHRDEVESLYSIIKNMKPDVDGFSKKEILDKTNARLEELLKLNTHPEFEFLRSKKFKIKAMKYSKFNVISQGIIFPLSILHDKIKPHEGLDVTELIGITKIVEDEIESGVSKKSKNKVFNFLMKFKIVRDLLGYDGTDRSTIEYYFRNYPGIASSDEENVQKIFTKLKNKFNNENIFYVTEKLEGQSISVAMLPTKCKFSIKNISNYFKHISFVVCSRCKVMDISSHNQFCETVLRHKICDKLEKHKKYVFLRGEHCGPSIQGNIYNFDQRTIFFYEAYDLIQKRWLNWDEFKELCKQLELNTVPLLETNYRLPDNVNDLLNYSNGYSLFGCKVLREGIVIRSLHDRNVSFKVRSPVYLCK